jgi:hypothetical protein
MKKKPRSRFRSQYNILFHLKEKYDLNDDQVNTLQSLIFHGGKIKKFLNASQDLEVVLAWIQQNLDPKFTESQLLKNIYQPNSLNEEMFKSLKKTKTDQPESDESEEKIEEKVRKTAEDQGKYVENEESKDDVVQDAKSKENGDFLERISIKKLTE